MTDEAIAKGYRHLADDCLREAKNGKFKEMREGHEKPADGWLKLADEKSRPRAPTKTVERLFCQRLRLAKATERAKSREACAEEGDGRGLGNCR